MSEASAPIDETEYQLLVLAVSRLVGGFRVLWLHPEFKPERGGSSGGGVWTEAAADARRLPETGRAVRGSAGVTVQVRGSFYDPWRSTPTLHGLVIRSLIRARDWPKDAQGGDIELLEQEANESYYALVDACRRAGQLAARLYEARGFKHYEPDEVQARMASHDKDYLEDLPIALTVVIEDALTGSGFTWEGLAEFDEWDKTAHLTTESLVELATRQFYEYDVLAYLSGPLVDQADPITIGLLPDHDGSVITLTYADDTTLRRATHEGPSLEGDDLPLSIRHSNTIVTFPVRVAVDAPVEAYLHVYRFGAERMVRIVDVLRIAQPAAIGLAGLRVSPRSRYTPMIRRAYAWEFEPDAAPYQTRRMIYPPPDEPISSEEIETVRRLLAIHLPGVERKGFGVALRRFRDSYERYPEGDYNRLLDIAIAFEALILNDGPDKELSYRLRLRGARWLEDTIEGRREVFRSLQHLYELRSRIAHGETTDSLKPKDVVRLREVMVRAPELLRRALRYVLEGRGPAGTKDEQIREWWRDLELS
jgi:hypothetical protein